MCKHDEASPCGVMPSVSARGSRRRRLWELDPKCHCPVIGVCLSIATLRKVVGRQFRQQDADDYAVHVSAVSHCTARSVLVELFQHALDRQHDLVLQRYRQARSREEVYQLWRGAVAEGKVAGPLWAALTHPACDAHLEELLCREIHMIQHQAGAQERLDRGAFTELKKEHGVLMRQLGTAQRRSTQLLAEKVQQVAELEAALMRLRAEVIKRDSAIAFLQADLCAARAEVPDLDARERLQLRNAELTRILQLRDERIEQLQHSQQHSRAPRPHADAEPDARPVHQDRGEASTPEPLDNKTILCVGGRAGSVAHYRNIVEQGGGRFAHHNGGNEQRADALDSDLAAADLVICQSACISHHAYWRVKDYCKRTGKACVFLDNPSTSSFARGLRHILLRQVPADSPHADLIPLTVA